MIPANDDYFIENSKFVCEKKNGMDSNPRMLWYGVVDRYVWANMSKI